MKTLVKDSRQKQATAGMTLVETLVATVVASLLLLVVGVLSVYGLRSFSAMGNCTELDAQSRQALDQISQDMRQATQVLSCGTNAFGATLVVSNGLRGMTIRYEWDADARTLSCEKSDQGEVVYLTQCDAWQVEMYRRTPQPGTTMTFVRTPNPAECKLVAMTWKCSRPIMGRAWNTETVQTAQIVLRNKR